MSGNPASYPAPEQQPAKREIPKLIRGAIYIAIAALLLAAIVCVVWVFMPNQGSLIGRAFLTILLLAAFSGAVLLDANLAGNRPPWLVLASVVTWVIALLVGAVKIWAPMAPEEFHYGSSMVRFMQLLCVVGLLQLGLLHQRLYWQAHRRYVTGFTRAIAIATTALLAAMILMLVFFLTFPYAIEYSEWYWRIVIALAILAAVGTLVLPLLNALFAPRERVERPASQPVAPPVAAYPGMQAPVQQGWPTFVDGVTPLPVLPDGAPDWEAYRTGVPSPGAWVPGRAAPAPQPAAPQAQPAPVQPAPQPAAAPQVPPVPPAPAPPQTHTAPHPPQLPALGAPQQ